MDKEKILELLNQKDIRCIGNSEEVIFVQSIDKYVNIDNKNYCDGINLVINSEQVIDNISQLYCIFTCGCYKNLEDLYSENHFYDDLEYFYNFIKEKIAPKPKELEYYWYYHMMTKANREAIQTAIKNKDFKTFIEYYKKYNSKGIKNGVFVEEFNSFYPIIYLPDEASYIVDNKCYYLNILNKDNFNRITYSECECG